MPRYEFFVRDQDPIIQQTIDDKDGIYDIKGTTGKIAQVFQNPDTLLVQVIGLSIQDNKACTSGCSPQRTFRIDDEVFKKVNLPREGKTAVIPKGRLLMGIRRTA